jgi:hypothetical protein
MRIFVEKNNTTLHKFKKTHKKQLFENELVNTDESQLFEFVIRNDELDVIEETVDHSGRQFLQLEIRKGDREPHSNVGSIVPF